MKTITPFLLTSLASFLPGLAFAAATATPGAPTDMAALAKQLNDPTASLYTLPLQNNIDYGGGPVDEGYQYKLNAQPVIPLEVNAEWKVISRYVIPYIYQDNLVGTSWQMGFGDTTATYWFAPAKKQPGQPVFGFGPILQLPTASEPELGTEKWSAGASFILLRQQEGWTYGMLANQLWSFAGHSDRDYVNYTFAQPFLTYTTPKHTTYGLNSESIYDWNTRQWTVPVNVFANQLVKIGQTPVTFQLGYRYYVEKPDRGPDWGLRFSVTFVFKQ